MLKIKNKFSLVVLIFQGVAIGAILMALIAAARAGNTTWCVICGVLGGLNTFLLITNILNNVRHYEPEKADIDVVQTVVHNILVEVDLKRQMGEEFSYGELMDRIEERYKQYYKED